MDLREFLEIVGILAGWTVAVVVVLYKLVTAPLFMRLKNVEETCGKVTTLDRDMIIVHADIRGLTESFAELQDELREIRTDQKQTLHELGEVKQNLAVLLDRSDGPRRKEVR